MIFNCNMEKRLKKKTNEYMSNFKSDIKDWLVQNNVSFDSDENNSKFNNFIQFVYDYNNIEFSQLDFQKRKRVKNIVPQFERCQARRANNEQCTRRKKDGECYCGTHIKGRPHGIISDIVENKMEKLTIWVKDIKGINYYIDDFGNIYSAEDIIQNSPNPKVVLHYKKEGDDYIILNNK